MLEPFSLARHAWIPVALEDGRREFVRPCDITSKIDGQNIIRISTGRPDCDVSLTEFLIGLLAVTIGPEDNREWAQHYSNPPDLERAFAPLASALNLDGDERRFFQDLKDLQGATTPVSALFMDAPAEHFVKAGRTGALSRHGVAIALVTLQTSAPAGGAGHRTSLRGGGPLTTLALPGTPDRSPPTLWQRLWANVPAGHNAQPTDYELVFPWLGRTRTSDPRNTGVTTTPADVHPAQAFFGMPRRIRLVFEPNTRRAPCDLLGHVDDVIVTGYVTRPWGNNYTGWSRGHPLSPYYQPKPSDPEFLPLHLQTSRVGYRDWLGMVMESVNGQRVPAACVDAFYARANQFPKNEARAFKDSRLYVSGYVMDNMKPLDFGESLLPLIVTGDPKASTRLKEVARQWVIAADLVANQLVSAVKRALYGEKGKADRDSTVLESVKARFWGETEQDFYGKLQDVAREIEAKAPSIDEYFDGLRRVHGALWLRSLKRHALAIFDATVPIDDAQSDKIKDVIDGRKMLVFALAGYGPVGGQLFEALSQPPKESKSKKGRKAT